MSVVVAGANDLTAGFADGGVEACGAAGNCITTIVQATPAKTGGLKTFGFTDTASPTTFNVKTSAAGIGGHLDKDITQPFVGTRLYTLGTYPTGITQTDDISCVSALNNGTSTWRRIVSGTTSKTKIALEVLTLGVGDSLTCTWHAH